jgi:hypothetical protein
VFFGKILESYVFTVELAVDVGECVHAGAQAKRKLRFRQVGKCTLTRSAFPKEEIATQRNGYGWAKTPLFLQTKQNEVIAHSKWA